MLIPPVGRPTPDFFYEWLLYIGDPYMHVNRLSEKVIGLAIKVHRTLGPGFLESVYQAALAYELDQARIPFEKEKAMPVHYGPVTLNVGFRCDFLVNGCLLLEIKATKKIMPIDHAQLLNYLKISRLHLGLILNFNVMVLKDGGIKRIVHQLV